ncbi:MAG: PDZ domain-containing protein [Holophagaceae bacterium]
MRRILATATLLLAAGSAPAAAPQLFRTPSLSRTHIAFAHAGDLWIVPREGGEARRLTTGAGVESMPWFSPDGSQVAFTADYDGNTDVYVVPAAGGTPRRLTWHPGADIAEGWTPDGTAVLFASGRASATGRTSQLYTIRLDRAFPEPLPLPAAAEGALSPDGGRLAYVPHRRAFTAWKRYRGGTATPIWIADLRDSSITKVPRNGSNDLCPMWVDGKVFFLSDREGPFALYAYDPATGKVEPKVPNKGLDFKHASAGPGGIVIEQFGAIHLYDPATGSLKPVPITLSADLPGVRPRFEKVATRLTTGALSPTGMRAVFEARGEVLTVPAEKGVIRNLTQTPGVMERSPAWSPDGKAIAYFSDASGEYAVHVKGQDGLGEARAYALPPGFYYNLAWSPDARKLAFSDKGLGIWVLDLETGKAARVDTTLRAERPRLSWSPDGRWLAYVKTVANEYSAVFVLGLEDGTVHQVTDGMDDAENAVFDPSGRHLWFTSSTTAGPAIFGFDMTSYPHRPTRSVRVAVLRKGDPSPFAPESDEEGGKKADGEKRPDTEKKAEEKKAEEKKPEEKKPDPVVIDFAGLDQRILALPIPERAVAGIAVGKGAVYILEPMAGRLDPPSGAILHKYDLAKRKLERVMDDVRSFDLSFNGEKMLVRQGEANWFIVPAGQAPKPPEGRLKMEDAEVRVDPKAEWAQMYRETWRLERDFFYDPNHHGLDLKAAEAKYAPYVDGLAHRADLNVLFQEMLGELTVGHLYVGGGDAPGAKAVPGGLLGADFAVDKGRYRFAKVFAGENWNPATRAPLTQPGSEVRAGEYLLAVNGRELRATESPYAPFENTAGKEVVLRVGPDPGGAGARNVKVVPVASEAALRNLDWIEGNRRLVEKLSGGRLAYVWLPNTANAGYANFNRYWFPQLDKQGAVLDERHNGGGSAADYFIDYLKKPVNSYWAVRDGLGFRQPFGTMPGPKAMLIDEDAGSGGDYLPWLFRREKLGPLVGTRTWGGLVGIGGYPVLMDGGTVTAPHFAFFTPEGQFDVENKGVPPDVEVDLDPKAWREGRDAQLEKAVALVMEALKAHPPVAVPKPVYPNYHR